MWWVCMYLSVIIFRYPKNQLKGGRSSKAPRSYWPFPPPTSTLKTEVSKGMKTCQGWAINVEEISLLSCPTLKHKPSTFLLPSPFHPLIPVFFFWGPRNDTFQPRELVDQSDVIAFLQDNLVLTEKKHMSRTLRDFEGEPEVAAVVSVGTKKGWG